MLMCLLMIVSVQCFWNTGQWNHRFPVQANVADWGSSRLIPANYDQVESLAAASLIEALTSSSNSTENKLFSIDVLTPGLNPKLEQKASLQQELLFSLALSLLPSLFSYFCVNVAFNEDADNSEEIIQYVFSSAGDAAGFGKYCRQSRVKFLYPVKLTAIESAVSSLASSTTARCAVFINAKNNVGDPVIREVQKICEENSKITFIFLNCDLSEKVASMRDRLIREKFRTSIKPVFYFRNLVEIVRPSLTPFEIGAILFTPRNAWQVFAVNEGDIVGPGSLNRYMKQAAFKKNPGDPTGVNPPRFVLAGNYPNDPPQRGDIDSILAKATFSVNRNAEAGSLRISENEPVLTVESAKSFIRNYNR